MEVTTPLRDFPGVGDARAKSLERLGLRTAGDLTAYFPRGYDCLLYTSPSPRDTR